MVNPMRLFDSVDGGRQAWENSLMSAMGVWTGPMGPKFSINLAARAVNVPNGEGTSLFLTRMNSPVSQLKNRALFNQER